MFIANYSSLRNGVKTTTFGGFYARQSPRAIRQQRLNLYAITLDQANPFARSMEKPNDNIERNKHR
jgi:hypothetical protein